MGCNYETSPGRRCRRTEVVTIRESRLSSTDAVHEMGRGLTLHTLKESRLEMAYKVLRHWPSSRHARVLELAWWEAATPRSS